MASADNCCVKSNDRSTQAGARYTQAGARYTQAGARYTQAGARYTQAGARYTQAGARYTQARARYTQAGARYTLAGARYTQAGARYTQARARYTQARARYTLAGARYTQAGARYTQAGTRYTQAGIRYTQAGARYTQAGARYALAGARYTQAGARYTQARARYTQAGARYTQARARFTLAGARYTHPGARYTHAGARYTHPGARYTQARARYTQAGARYKLRLGAPANRGRWYYSPAMAKTPAELIPAAEARRVPANFITDVIDADLQSGRHTRVVTRFPPEPNGYAHLGHAFASYIDFTPAIDYRGVCHLRMDDTNPEGETQEYADSIIRDLQWLGCDTSRLFYASDYYERLYDCAVELVERGLAYVESVSAEEMARLRGTVEVPGTPSPYRDRIVGESLDLFRRMRAGEFKNGEHVLRAKIDLANPNFKLRDPVLYRILHARHYRTGDTWCVYPMYDFAHIRSAMRSRVSRTACAASSSWTTARSTTGSWTTSSRRTRRA